VSKHTSSIGIRLPWPQKSQKTKPTNNGYETSHWILTGRHHGSLSRWPRRNGRSRRHVPFSNRLRFNIPTSGVMVQHNHGCKVSGNGCSGIPHVEGKMLYIDIYSTYLSRSRIIPRFLSFYQTRLGKLWSDYFCEAKEPGPMVKWEWSCLYGDKTSKNVIPSHIWWLWLIRQDEQTVLVGLAYHLNIYKIRKWLRGWDRYNSPTLSWGSNRVQLVHLGLPLNICKENMHNIYTSLLNGSGRISKLDKIGIPNLPSKFNDFHRMVGYVHLQHWA